jgi:GAF domain-containing protein
MTEKKEGTQISRPRDMRSDAQAVTNATRLSAGAGAAPTAIWRALAQGVAQHPGDAAVVHLLGHHGRSIRAAALHHPDAAARTLMLDILALGPQTLVDAFTLRVLQTGRALRIPISSDDLLRLWVQPEFAAYLDTHTVTSILVVPMRVGRRRLGALRVWRERPGAPFSDEDELYVQGLADGVVAAAQHMPRPGRIPLGSGRVLQLRSHPTKTLR